MGLIEVGATFPGASLPDWDGQVRPVADAWSAGPALVIVGHRNCKTTRQTLPYVEQIHRRRGAGATALAVLQDDVPTARALAAELGLSLPIRLEAEPYPLAEALGLVTVPTLFLVEPGGRVAHVTEGFRRADLETLASRLGVTGGLFAADDKSPAMRPG